MDAFYASVEQRDRPELRGRPVIVGGAGPRGVVSSASYEARRCGVRAAMPSGEARRRCPDGIFVCGDMRRYARESRRIFEIFARFSPCIEGLSLDEAFLDLTGCERLLGSAREVGDSLRRAVRDEVGLAVSVGIAPSRLVAKVASDLAKPDGLLEVAPDEVAAFLAPLPVGRLWSVGPVSEAKLITAGLRTIGDVARAAPDRLEALLGRHGRHLARLAVGDDPLPVDPARAPVSISEENTFDVDVRDAVLLAATALAHAEAVARRLRREALRARTVVLKLTLAGRRRPGPRGFDRITRRVTLASATDDGAVIHREACRLLERAALAEPVRLLGVGVTGLEPRAQAQPALFDEPAAGARRDRLNRALDALEGRFGPGTVARAGAAPARRAGLTLQIKRGETPPGS